ncbi:MAG: deoxyuridine 5'-triphosphate nucleotidohydrolase [Chloroflexi bacterium]|nr:deoxyuridine 5'-triphosphate nucleotidohydrolase [Chloroflexota bacterium]
MSVLSREGLTEALRADPPLVEGLDEATQIQPNGIDLRLERVQRLISAGALGIAEQSREPAAREDVAPDRDGWWALGPGAYVITFRERVNLPRDLAALGRARSSLVRSGVALHGGVWDAGYSGRGEGLLSVLNPAGYRVQRGARIMQLVFFRLESAADEGYRGRYQEGRAG